MDNFHIVINNSKKGAKGLGEKIYNYLLENNRKVQISNGYIKKNELLPKTQCIITVGGDGTLINVARSVAVKNIPIIGINKGHLGYLTALKDDNKLYEQLRQLVINDYDIEKRMMINGIVIHKDGSSDNFLALNDVVITKNISGMTVKLSVNINGEFLNDYIADGIIIATPTGSTAYNLSAGGPITKPDAELMIITPICPHSLNLRSLILDSHDEISIKLNKNLSGEEIMVFDGEDKINLKKGDEIIIKKSNIYTLFVKLQKENFLDNIRSKMSNI